MRTAFSYGKKRNYPHMKPLDVAIWERFVEKNPDAYDFVYYDFELGSAPAWLDKTDPEGTEKMRALYQWKADVVGVKGTRVDIIELKPRAGISAIGQAACYERLWKRDWDPEGDDRAIIITDELRPDMEWLAGELGVDIIVV